MTRTESNIMWNELINDYNSSGKPAREWCLEHDIPVSRLRYHINRADKKALGINEVNWLPVNLADSNTTSAITIKVGCTSIEITEGFNPSLLAEVISALRKVC